MSDSNTPVKILQPINLDYLERLQSTIDFSAINVNPGRTPINSSTYSKKTDDSNILVDMSNNNAFNLQVMPISNLRRRQALINRDVPTTPPEPDTYTDMDKKLGFVPGGFSVWLSSLFMLFVVTPSVCNLLVITVLMTGSYYYAAMFQASGLAIPATFWDRTMWAIGCAAVVYSTYYILDGLAQLMENRVNLWFGPNQLSRIEQELDAMKPNTSNVDFWTAAWRIFYRNLDPYVLVYNMAWFIHTTSRAIMKLLCYMSLAFYVTAMLWSQMGVPYSILPNNNSPIVGLFISGLERALGPVAVPLTNLWSQPAYVMPTMPAQTYATAQPYGHNPRYDEYFQ